jgi:hypothetical protein
VKRRTGVKWSNDSLDLREDPFLLLGGTGDHGESTSSLTVQTEVLSLAMHEMRVEELTLAKDWQSMS